MKTLFAIAALILIGCAVHADAHGNPGGAIGALFFAILWFVAYCYADRIS